MESLTKNQAIIIAAVLVCVIVVGGFAYRDVMKSKVAGDQYALGDATLDFGTSTTTITKETQSANTTVKTPTTPTTNPVTKPQTNPTKPMQTAKAGDIVSVKYTGKFADGKVFDATDLHGGTPIQFKLGAGQVIKGWDQGIVGMTVGEKKSLTIPPELGYGPNDYGPIPGNSTLYFDVELVAIN